MKKGKFRAFVREMIHRIQDDDVSALGAQLTFYWILSLFPFLIFLITLASYTPFVREDVLRDLHYVLPANTADLVTDIVRDTVANRSEALLSFGMLGTVWAASRGVMAIIKGVNKAYDEEEDRPFWKVRGLAILYTLVLAVVILLSVVMVVFGRMIGERIFIWFDYAEWFETVWNVTKVAIPPVVMIIVFLLLYRNAPNRKLSFMEVTPGAFFATAGWIATSLLFSFYVNHFGNFAKTYGSIGGIIVLLIWMYVSNIIIILGGEINAALALVRQGRHRPHLKQFGFDIPFLRTSRPEKQDPDRKER